MKINNKGYAITLIVFGILIIFIVVLSTLLITMNNSVKLNKTVKEDVIESVQLSVDTTGMTLTERIDNLEDIVSNMKRETINEIYPVGSVYISTTDDTKEKVQARFGGEWEVYAQGRTLVGVGGTTDSNGNVLVYENNKIGGSSLTALNASNLPSHSHSIPALSGTAASTGSGYALGHTCETRTTSSNGNHQHALRMQWGDNTGNIGFIESGNGRLTVDQGRGVTAPNGAHTHTYPDCYLSSLGGVAPHAHSVTTTANNTGAAGSSTSFSVQNPYITVYMYKRIR